MPIVIPWAIALLLSIPKNYAKPIHSLTKSHKGKETLVYLRYISEREEEKKEKKP